MVKKIFIIIFLLFSFASVKAEVILSVQRNTWQEYVKISNDSSDDRALTNFTGYGIEFGIETKFLKRYKYVPTITLINGNADIIKITNYLSPRKKNISLRINQGLLYAVTRSFYIGGSGVLNYNQVQDLDSVLSSGLFMSIENQVYKDIHLFLNIGTISDSKQLAYNVGLKKVF